jgi:hypothetical protein
MTTEIANLRDGRLRELLLREVPEAYKYEVQDLVGILARQSVRRMIVQPIKTTGRTSVTPL